MDKQNGTPLSKPKKLSLKVETIQNLQTQSSLDPTRAPTLPPGCSGPSWRCW